MNITTAFSLDLFGLVPMKMLSIFGTIRSSAESDGGDEAACEDAVVEDGGGEDAVDEFNRLMIRLNTTDMISHGLAFNASCIED